MPQSFGAGLRFLDALDVLPELIGTLRERERPDLVVLVSHYGVAQEVAIARAVDGIDVILGRHTHDVLARAVVVGRTILTQSGAHGSYMTRLALDVANRRVVDCRHLLIPVVAEGVTDGGVEDVVRESLRPHREALDEVVGETRTLLHRGAVLEAPMDTVITKAYRASTEADVALSHGWRYGTPSPPGPITAGDLWQMIPTNPELFTARLTGAQLWRMLEQSLERSFAGDALRQQGGYPMRFAGMRVVARVNNPAGSRLQQVEIGGVKLDPDREYAVAAAGEQSITGGSDRVRSGLSAIDSVRAYLARPRPDSALDERPTLVAA